MPEAEAITMAVAMATRAWFVISPYHLSTTITLFITVASCCCSITIKAQFAIASTCYYHHLHQAVVTKQQQQYWKFKGVLLPDL